MTDQERALAKQRVAPDVAEIFQQDPADEAQVQPGQQEQVARAQGALGREDADQVRDAHVAGGQHDGGHGSAVGEPDRPERIGGADRKPGRGDHDRLPPQRRAGAERHYPGHHADHRELGAAEGAGRQRPLTREVDPVDGLVREVVAGHREQQERADHDQRSGQQDLALPVTRFGQPRRREHRQQDDDGRAGQQDDQAQPRHLLLP